MKYILAILALLSAATVCATTISYRPLEEIVRSADYVVVANIVDVDMVDESGKQATDPQARTGPTTPYILRYHLKVKETLFTRSNKVPSSVVIPLDRSSFYALDFMRDGAKRQDSIFLLKVDTFRGAPYKFAYLLDFQRPMEEKSQVLEWLKPR